MEDIPHFFGAIIWQFWIGGALGVVLAIEPVTRYCWPGYDAWAAMYLTGSHRKDLKWGAAGLAFVLASYLAYHDLSADLRAANVRVANLDPTKVKALQDQIDAVRWAPLTDDQTKILRKTARSLAPQTITVACETANCKDLADGIAAILAETPGWKVTVLHRGGWDISGTVGIKIQPREAATKQLQDWIEAATKLKIDLGDETREQVGSVESYLTVGNKPF